MRKNANEHAIGALGCVDTERQPMLLDVEREERAVTSGVSEAFGALVDSVKRSGWALSSVGRRERCERMDEALRARIVLEYSIRGVSSARMSPMSRHNSGPWWDGRSLLANAVSHQ